MEQPASLRKLAEFLNTHFRLEAASDGATVRVGTPKAGMLSQYRHKPLCVHQVNELQLCVYAVGYRAAWCRRSFDGTAGGTSHDERGPSESKRWRWPVLWCRQEALQECHLQER